MTTVTIHHDLPSLARAVDGHMDRAAQNGLHDRLAWFDLTGRYCPPEGKPAFVYASGPAGGLVLPLASQRERAEAFASWYTLAWAPVRWGDSDGLLPAAVEALRHFSVVRLAPVAARDAGAVAAAFRDAAWQVRNQAGKAHWIAHTEGLEFTRYWASRPSHLRNTVARKRKKAGLEVRIHDRFDPRGWADYEAVYAASWKPHEGAPAFLRALAEQEGAAGTLRLGIAHGQGQPVAAQLWLVENGVATIHKLAYREDARDLSPGSILSAAMFEHVLTRDRPRAISYGLGDEAYKADWMDAREEMRELTILNPRRPLGLALLAKAGLRRLVKGGRAD